MDIEGTEVLTLTNSAMTLKGTTPTLTIGDAGAEDTKIVFDGNAQDYYIALDDSADTLIIGNGSTVGSSPALTIDSDEVGTFAKSLKVGQYLHLQTTDDQANAWLAYTHTDDTLRFNYNGSGADEIVVDTAGRGGIGATPESWSSTWEVLQVGAKGAIISQNGDALQLAENSYNDGSGSWKAIATGSSSFFSLDNGGIQMYTAPSVSADASQTLSLIHILRCRRYSLCRSRWSPYN